MTLIRVEIVVFLVTLLTCLKTVECQFMECINDPSNTPVEGIARELQFTWLGALQYIHVKNGTPHYFRVPRVALITRQYALSTAVDASKVPIGYALGNVVFVDYERDEDECQMSVKDLMNGKECEPATLLMPISDVLLHPEYKHFGAKNSLALLKLLRGVKSSYMVPACLPFKDFVTRRDGRQVTDKFLHVDFTSDVPRDYADEDKEIQKVSLLPRELCYLYDMPKNSSHYAKRRMMCTSGCGFHSGAPTIIHEHTGHWSLVALALGGAPCADPLRPKRPPPPPRHLLIHPYVPWITAAVTGHAIGAFSRDDPFGLSISRMSPYDLVGHGYVGHWYLGGLRCYDRADAADDIFVFYHEIFRVKPSNPTWMSYSVEISAPPKTQIICVKVGMPYRLGRPKVYDLDTQLAKIDIPVIHFAQAYRFEVEAWAYNLSESGSSCPSSCDSADSECKEEKAWGSNEPGNRRNQDADHVDLI